MNAILDTSQPKPAKRKTTKTDAKPSERVSLKAICSKLRIDAYDARRILRKRGFAFHDHGERWSFTAKQADLIREALKGHARNN